MRQPFTLPDLRRQYLFQDRGEPRTRNGRAQAVLDKAVGDLRIARLAVEAKAPLQAIGLLHDAAHHTFQAAALHAGFGFAGSDGSHMAVIDYAYGAKLVNRSEWEHLEELRLARNDNRYTEEKLELPTDTMTTLDRVIDRSITTVRQQLAPKTPAPSTNPERQQRRIPPPPTLER